MTLPLLCDTVGGANDGVCRRILRSGHDDLLTSVYVDGSGYTLIVGAAARMASGLSPQHDGHNSNSQQDDTDSNHTADNDHAHVDSEHK